MTSLLTIHAYSDAELPSVSKWQESIGKLDLIIPVQLISVAAQQGRESSMNIRGQSVRFRCEVVSAGPAKDKARSSGWSNVYGFGDFGKGVEDTAATIACVSCALATGGAVDRLGSEPVRDVTEVRKQLDFLLAGDLGCDEAYFSRYPSERETEPVGPARIEIRLHR